MASAAFYALIGEVLIFALIAIRYGWIYMTTNRSRCADSLLCLHFQRDRRGEFVSAEAGLTEADSTGTGARRRVQGMLSIACFARAALTMLVFMQGTWMPYLVIPDLIFVATYGQLVLFLAQTQQTAIGVGYRRTRLTLCSAVVLGLVLIVSLVMCEERWRANPDSPLSLLLRRVLYYELGVTYLLMCGAFTYYALRVICASRLHQAMFSRMILLTLVCGLALLSKGTSFVISASEGWRAVVPIPSSPRRYRIEALVALEELLPSLAILVLTEKGKRGAFVSPALSETSALARYGQSPTFNPSSNVTLGSAPRGQCGYGTPVNQA